MRSSFSKPEFPVRTGRQKGAALFVAMMILIIMSLLAVSASQVTVMQERMVQAYWSDFQAFESAEMRLRRWEQELRAEIATSECPLLESVPRPAWMGGSSFPTASGEFRASVQDDDFYRRRAGIQNSSGLGLPGTSLECSFFITSVADNDVRDDAKARSWAVVQSVFVP
jgi:type IV pilus assembly protein PilX